MNELYGLDDLRMRRLKVAQIDDLNDPFDLRVFASSDPQMRQALERHRSNLAKSHCMLCFSRNWKNPVQWSHYADRHRGMCLGFDVPGHLLTPVQYGPKRVELDIDTLLARQQEALTLMIQASTTKFSHWKYEQEERVFVNLEYRDPKTGLYFVDFSSNLQLKEVIAGHNSRLSRASVASALGAHSNEVSTFKARLAFKSFRVVRQRNERLWQ